MVCLSCNGGSALAQGAPDAQPDMRLMRVTSLPRPTQMHAAAVVGNRLYTFGGHSEIRNRQGAVSSVWSDESFSAPILSNGQLGEWRAERRLPDRRSYIASSTEVVENRIYIIAGLVSPRADAPEAEPQTTRTAIWTSVNEDGSLSEWRRTAEFPGSPVGNGASCSSNEALYLMGGSYSTQGVVNQVIIGKLAADGAVASWERTTPLPTALWFHGASLQEGRIYVWGGLPTRGNEILNSKVWSAPVQQGGSLGIWREEAIVSNPVYSSCFEGFNEYLLSIAGRYRNGYPTGAIWYTRLNGGQVEQWNLLRTDLETRLYAAVAVDPARGNVYVTGGRFRPGLDVEVGKVLDTVQAFRVEQPASKRLPALTEVTVRADASRASAPELTQYPRLVDALAEARRSGKSVLAVFYSPEVPGVRRLRDNVLSRPEFAAAAAPYHMAAADISGADAELTHKYAVYQIPTLLVLSSDGQVIRRLSRPQTLEEVVHFLKQP